MGEFSVKLNFWSSCKNTGGRSSGDNTNSSIGTSDCLGGVPLSVARIKN